MDYIKLTDYAKKMGVCYRTAWDWFNKGLIEGAIKLPTDTILVPDIVNNKLAPKHRNKAIIYARVSNHDRKESLEKQLDDLRKYADARQFRVISEYKEVASGMNDSRKKLMKILNTENYGYLIVENKDRLTRFGFNYIKELLKTKGIEVIVLNEAEDEQEDLVKDLVSIIYSFSARMYGKRRGKQKTKDLINKVKEETSRK